MRPMTRRSWWGERKLVFIGTCSVTITPVRVYKVHSQKSDNKQRRSSSLVGPGGASESEPECVSVRECVWVWAWA